MKEYYFNTKNIFIAISSAFMLMIFSLSASADTIPGSNNLACGGNHFGFPINCCENYINSLICRFLSLGNPIYTGYLSKYEDAVDVSVPAGNGVALTVSRHYTSRPTSEYYNSGESILGKYWHTNVEMYIILPPHNMITGQPHLCPGLPAGWSYSSGDYVCTTNPPDVTCPMDAGKDPIPGCCPENCGIFCTYHPFADAVFYDGDDCDRLCKLGEVGYCDSLDCDSMLMLDAVTKNVDCIELDAIDRTVFNPYAVFIDERGGFYQFIHPTVTVEGEVINYDNFAPDYYALNPSHGKSLSLHVDRDTVVGEPDYVVCTINHADGSKYVFEGYQYTNIVDMGQSSNNWTINPNGVAWLTKIIDPYDNVIEIERIVDEGSGLISEDNGHLVQKVWAHKGDPDKECYLEFDYDVPVENLENILYYRGEYGPITLVSYDYSYDRLAQVRPFGKSAGEYFKYGNFNPSGSGSNAIDNKSHGIIADSNSTLIAEHGTFNGGNNYTSTRYLWHPYDSGPNPDVDSYVMQQWNAVYDDPASGGYDNDPLTVDSYKQIFSVSPHLEYDEFADIDRPYGGVFTIYSDSGNATFNLETSVTREPSSVEYSSPYETSSMAAVWNYSTHQPSVTRRFDGEEWVTLQEDVTSFDLPTTDWWLQEHEDDVFSSRLLMNTKKYINYDNPMSPVYHETTNEYDQHGIYSRIELTYDNDGNSIKYFYDFHNSDVRKIKSITVKQGVNGDSDKNLSITYFNENGTLASTHVMSDDGSTSYSTYYAYNDEGFLESVTGPDGLESTNVYDELGRVVSTTDPTGAVTEYEYDDDGWFGIETVTVKRDPGTSADDIITVYTYDYLGRVKTITEPKYHGTGTKTTNHYDGLGQLVKVTDAAAGDTKYLYDRHGQMVKLTDARSKATLYTFDAMNRLIEEEDDDGNTSIYEYDAGGCGSCGGGGHGLTEVIDPRGWKTEFDYDLAGRMMEARYYNATPSLIRTINYNYSKSGRINWLQDDKFNNWGNSGKTTWAYDSRNRLISETSPDGYVISYVYDGFRRRESLTDPDGVHTELAFSEDDGHLETITNSFGQMTEYSYDAYSRLNRIDLPNGAYSTLTYDNISRLNTLGNYRPNDSALRTFTYAYDKNSNIIEVDFGNDNRIEYGYTSLNQLSGESMRLDDPAWGRSYTYDAVGNRTTMNINNIVGGGSTNETTTYYYEDNNELNYRVVNNGSSQIKHDYSFDQAGNMSAVEQLTWNGSSYDSDGYARSLLHDEMNKMTGSTWYPTLPGTVRQASFTYDGLGRRVLRTVGSERTRYFYDGLKVLVEKSLLEDPASGYAVPSIKEDGSNGLGSPAADGKWHQWDQPSGAGTLSAALDSARKSNVVKFDPAVAWTNSWIIGDDETNKNPNDTPWQEQNRHILSAWIKSEATKSFQVYVRVQLTNGQYRMLYYEAIGGSDSVGCGGACYNFRMGTGLRNGAWHYLERDIEADILSLEGGVALSKVNAVFVRPEGDFWLDDLRLSTGFSETRYTLGAGAVGGLISKRTHTPTNHGYTDTYFHYDHIGNVTHLTDSAGAIADEYWQDAFGNVINNTTGEWLGLTHTDQKGYHLTTKEFDSNVGYYYYNARWYDSILGRFNRPNSPYNLSNNNPIGIKSHPLPPIPGLPPSAPYPGSYPCGGVKQCVSDCIKAGGSSFFCHLGCMFIYTKPCPPPPPAPPAPAPAKPAPPTLPTYPPCNIEAVISWINKEYPDSQEYAKSDACQEVCNNSCGANTPDAKTCQHQCFARFATGAIPDAGVLNPGPSRF